MKLDELQKEADKDLEILKDRLDYESTRTPILFNKYYRFLLATKKQIKEYEYKYKVLYKDKWLYYTGKADAEVYKKTPFDLKILKQDLAIFMDADKDLADLKYKMEILKMKHDFINDIIGEIGRRSFLISNAIKALNYYHGDLG